MHGHLNRHFAFYTTQQYSEAVAAMSSRHRSLLALTTIMAVALPCVAAQPTDTPPQPLTSTDELKQNFLAEHEIGRRFHVDPADLPAPKSGAIVTNRPLVLPYNGQIPQVPPGFTATP